MPIIKTMVANQIQSTDTTSLVKSDKNLAGIVHLYPTYMMQHDNS